MSPIVLDTTAYSAFNRGDPRLKGYFSTSNELIMPTVVVGELRAGFAAGNHQSENEELLQRFLDSPNVSTVTINDATTKLYAAIYLALRKKGKPIGTNDMWIAAIALEQDCLLLALDSDFKHVPDLMLAKI